MFNRDGHSTTCHAATMANAHITGDHMEFWGGQSMHDTHTHTRTHTRTHTHAHAHAHTHTHIHCDFYHVGAS